jgi:RNA polymerase sigma factor (sigma-70 family)
MRRGASLRARVRDRTGGGSGMKVTQFPMLLAEKDPAEIARLQEALGEANLVNPLRIVDHGRKVVEYLSGTEEFADRDAHPLPSLVLLATTLPDIPGPKVLAWIRSQDPLKNLPVILLVSSAEEAGEEPSTPGPGVTARLLKPVDGERLIESLKSVGMSWMILGRSAPDPGVPAPSRQAPHVLVVDRDADFLTGLGESLRRRAPSILMESALDAPDAIRRLSRNSLKALVYERSIDEDGEFGFLDRVRTASPDLAVIVLCAEPDPAFEARAAGKGVRGVLLKQVRLDVFSDRLHELLVRAVRIPLPSPPGAFIQETASPADEGLHGRQDTDLLGHQMTFQETAWSLVQAAPRVDALDALIRIYWKPLYFFVRRRGFANEEAKDIVQEFLMSALERGMIPKADPLRGRFRTFLLAGLTNFLKDRRRSRLRLKRGGGQAPMSLDPELGEPKYATSVNTGDPPEVIVDRQWAKDLLDRCLRKLEGKASHLRAFDLQMEGLDYASIGQMTGLSQTAAKTAVHRLRVRLRGILRSHLSLGNATESEVERDLADFASLLG